MGIASETPEEAPRDSRKKIGGHGKLVLGSRRIPKVARRYD
ncbi:Protein of unknown function [Pyronema omphalodes CBS 100304]|uniref:Uncharacterized protein n=1 Tax=Pyronema omphalodes (strain CBS 100304) TaxID=1076935 RepID=U4LAM3_PYROM|nr:Protein of unknown function [Pyronema omphalodes CBS 100304]